MQFTNHIINTIEPLSAYGEYSDEILAPSGRKIFRPENHLAHELSPYLQLHSADPVGWYPWGQEAFTAALREDKPVFVSIGFYSEHWCRKMHSECFADIEAAGMINDTCIPICVDREERPDINDFFMEACRLQNGSAGWPLNIFLTPEGRPFFCTTWLGKRTMGKVPGITELLPRIKWLWHVQRNDVEREASDLHNMLKARMHELAGSKSRSVRIGHHIAFQALNDLRTIFDVQWGGFGGAPKFPEAVKLLFLLAQARDNKSLTQRDKSDAITMTDITLRRMWRGGIHDHLGGGFSRYAADDKWLVPHWEKLLCDQALLLYAVSLAQQLQDNSFHKLFAEDIVSCSAKYFAGDTAYSQGYVSSLCGDTPDGEGRYYLWTDSEVKRILPENEAGLFCAAYGVLPGGNFGSELAGAQIAQNILYEASTVTELAGRFGIKPRDIGGWLSQCRKLLTEYRDKRYPLSADNKILMGWNGLMIAALAKASIVFDCQDWKDIAERTALFLQKNLRDKNGLYYRVWLDGKLTVPALAEDYAYFLWGIVELYKAAKHFKAGDRQLNDWLKYAQELADTMITTYWDDKYSGLILSARENSGLMANMKSCEDNNSLPNANAISAIVLTDLGIILEDKKYSDYARKILDCFGGYARDYSLLCLSLIAADMHYKPVKKKSVPPPAPIPTDEELNAPEAQPADTPPQEDKKPLKPSSRTSRSDRTDRAERRRRASRSRER